MDHLCGPGERIADWAEAAQAGLRDVDELLDANLFYRPRMRGLATVKVDTILVPDAGAEAKGKLWGRWKRTRPAPSFDDETQEGRDPRSLVLRRGVYPTRDRRVTSRA